MHALKGTLANIGAIELSKEAARFESHFGAANFNIPKGIEKFQQDIKELLRAIELLKQERKSEEFQKDSVDIVSAVAFLDEVLEMLDKDISKSFESLAKVEKLLGNSTFSENYLNIEKMVQSFQLDEAKDAIKHLIDAIKEEREDAN